MLKTARIVIVNESRPVEILCAILLKNIDKNLHACIMQCMVLEIFLYGFITAFGWWTATHYVIEPHFPPPVEKKVEEKKEKTTDASKSR